MRSRPILFAILCVVVLLGIALACGFFMPGTWHAQAHATIQAPPAVVHAWLAEPARWPKWMPWSSTKDPAIRYTFRGPKSGVGAVLEWHSQKVGEGTLTLTKSDPRTGIAYDLAFAGSRQPSHGEIALAPDGEATRVTWSDGGELGANPIARLFRAPVEGMLSKEFADALARLASACEADAHAPPPGNPGNPAAPSPPPSSAPAHPGG